MPNKTVEISLESAIKAQKDGNIALAKSLYVEILNKQEDNIQALVNLGALYKGQGHYSLSLGMLKKAEMVAPNHLSILLNLATLYMEISDANQAMQYYEKAQKISPNDANIDNMIAIAYEKAGDNTKAMHYYKEAIKKDVKFVKAYNNIGVILYRQGQYTRAIELFKMALEADINYLPTYVNLGASCNKAGMYEQGEQILLDLLARDENYAGAYANLGNIYNKQNRYDKALWAHEKALELDSKAASNYANIGITYKNLHRYEEAKEALETAIMIDPHFTNAHFDLATTYLMLEEYESGFEAYEWRFQKPQMRTLLQESEEIVSQPKFALDLETKNKTLLLYTEQGFGDILQFSRFVSLLKKRFSDLTVHIQVRKELKTLFEELDMFDKVYDKEESLGAFDYQYALMSLPYLFGVTKEEIDNQAYIPMPTGELEIELDSDTSNIGIVWGASNTGESYHDKVFSLEYFKPLLKEDAIRLYSLQVGEDAAQIEELGLDKDIVDLAPLLTDFRQTALAINQLDMVVTSDTSVAHLAGALGKEVVILLQKNADWRWGRGGEESVWYESATLLRQEKQGEWDVVFDQLESLLKKRVA